MRNRKLKIAVGVGAVALIGGGIAGIAGIAGADPSTKSIEFVDGFGKVTDDWNDHVREAGVLCEEDCDNSSDTDLVVLWQSVLAADGYLTTDDIDGEFGPDTADATAQWQEDNELDPSGAVTQGVWATADDYLEDEGDGHTVTYIGGEGDVTMWRTDDMDGAYSLRSVTDAEGNEVTGDSDRIYLFGRSIVLE